MSIREEIGDDKWLMWPTGATEAIERLEACLQDVKHQISRAWATGDKLYLDRAKESIEANL